MPCLSFTSSSVVSLYFSAQIRRPLFFHFDCHIPVAFHSFIPPRQIIFCKEGRLKATFGSFIQRTDQGRNRFFEESDNQRLYLLHPRAMASVAVDQKTAAVVGAGVAGLVCAAELAANGVRVSVFDMGRAPGGRMSQRRERREGGPDLLFDHGCQYFTAKDPSVQSLVDSWQAAGIVADWTGRFGTLDAKNGDYVEDAKKSRYVGVPGMNAICQHLAVTPGVTPQYGVIVNKIERVATMDDSQQSDATWQVQSQQGDLLGNFDAVVIAAAYKTFRIACEGVPTVQSGLWGVEAAPCFALMVGFETPLQKIPYDAALVTGSEMISWVARDSSKPGRGEGSKGSECWVVHSTADYASATMRRAPPGRLSPQFLEGVAEEMLTAFLSLAGEVATPVHMRAHRWGGAFPTTGAAAEAKCIVDKKSRVAACGDFCVSPRVESAILSGLAAAAEIGKLLREDKERGPEESRL